MVTNNFKKLMSGLILNLRPDVAYYLVPATNGISYKNTSNISKTWDSSSTTANENAVKTTFRRLNAPVTNSSSQGTYIRVGTGTTAPTEDDYNLETWNSDIVCDSISSAYTPNSTKSYTATFSNTTANDVQVTEIGLFVTMAIFTDSATNDEDVLLDRTILSTPITIPAGQSKSITYEIAF